LVKIAFSISNSGEGDFERWTSRYAGLKCLRFAKVYEEGIRRDGMNAKTRSEHGAENGGSKKLRWPNMLAGTVEFEISFTAAHSLI
jgi:hypothetical protein